MVCEEAKNRQPDQTREENRMIVMFLESIEWKRKTQINRVDAPVILASDGISAVVEQADGMTGEGCDRNEETNREDAVERDATPEAG